MVGAMARPARGEAADTGSAVAALRASGTLRSPLLGLPGVGPRTAERLAAAGLHTRADLLDLVPRRWDDLSRLSPIGALALARPQITRARVVSSRLLFGRRRSLEVRFVDDVDGAGGAAGPVLIGRWFRARTGMRDRFVPGARFLVSGVVREHGGVRMMVHPVTELLEDDDVGGGALGVRAVYPPIDGVPGKLVAKLARLLARAHAADVPDGLPAALLRERGLPGRGEALAALHAAGEEGAAEAPGAANLVEALSSGRHPAQQRLVFEELFLLQLGLAARRAAAARRPAWACPPDARVLSRFLGALPFAPTAAQHRALAELGADLGQGRAMHRLLQGDVGTGKTVVMYGAGLQAMAAGGQVAMLAPTALLAEQHARTLAPWAAATGRRLALLTAATRRAERGVLLEGLASEGAGRIDLVVGTHALLAERVRFGRLALVIVDEQHRFGVAQRAALSAAGSDGRAPHLLVATATPIPRSLALTVFGDLDVAVIDEPPPGRTPPETRLLLGARGRALAYQALLTAIDAGRQAFVVCPRVGPDDDGDGVAPFDDEEDPDVGSAIATHRRLTRMLPGAAVGLLHGRLPAAERDATVRAFAAGLLRVLVATTVVEVGVDVPDAEVMLIDGAERFGLAQLHQLRGRIGRRPLPPGAKAPLCLLASTATPGSEVAARLEVLVGSTSGLAIAEADLAARGPGEILGTLQAGRFGLRFADLARDLPLVEEARRAAFALIEQDPELARPEHRATAAALEELGRRLGGGG